MASSMFTIYSHNPLRIYGIKIAPRLFLRQIVNFDRNRFMSGQSLCFFSSLDEFFESDKYLKNIEMFSLSPKWNKFLSSWSLATDVGILKVFIDDSNQALTKFYFGQVSEDDSSIVIREMMKEEPFKKLYISLGVDKTFEYRDYYIKVRRVPSLYSSNF